MSKNTKVQSCFLYLFGRKGELLGQRWCSQNELFCIVFEAFLFGAYGIIQQSEAYNGSHHYEYTHTHRHTP